jgi:hypothetical protein
MDSSLACFSLIKKGFSFSMQGCLSAIFNLKYARLTYKKKNAAFENFHIFS